MIKNMTNSSLLINTDQRGVCTINLNRPEKHNAFNAEIIAELLDALVQVNSDAGIRVVVISGVGESFSSGADLEWMRASAEFDEASNIHDAKQLSDLMRVLYELNKPSIARINGSAFGGALGLIACCDIAIAIDTAEFAFSEVRLGLAPAVISPYILMSIGPRHARRLFLTAERFSAADALAFDLVHKVCAADQLDQETDKQIAMLLKAGPQAITVCKALVPRLTNEQIDTELTVLIAKLRISAEGQEGLTAFFEKRKPDWVKD